MQKGGELAKKIGVMVVEVSGCGWGLGRDGRGMFAE